MQSDDGSRSKVVRTKSAKPKKNVKLESETRAREARCAFEERFPPRTARLKKKKYKTHDTYHSSPSHKSLGIRDTLA